MLKKTITYTDFNGEEVKEDFFFHLSKAELIELEMSHNEGLSTALQNIIDANDGKAIMDEMKKIIMMSYGKKSTDGKRFIKNQNLREEFASSEAYSTLFVELVTDADAATIFMDGIIPAGVEEMAEKISKLNEPKPDPTIVTLSELAALSSEEYAVMQEKISSGEVVVAQSFERY